MDERWQEIERIYHAACEIDKNARAEFLTKSCGGDDDLRRRVEFLVAQDEQAESFLESPAIEVVAESLVNDENVSGPAKPAFEIGAMVAHYRLMAKIGQGGMGEVYRARDTKLQRDVALKILPQALAHDAERMARFEREAQVLASLNHPNIAAIYGLEESNGIRALVMELVEGETLAERISVAPGFSPARAGLKAGATTREPKGLPYQDALPIARQITEALEYAHERGIIHRDLKPANIKITPEGTVKVLDFGLAKAVAPGFSPANAGLKVGATESSTDVTLATQPGMILGTAAYMSPEQARGLNVDRRCDIWAFGCVLYEMLAGRKAFDGETISDVLAAVITKEPDLAALPPTTPSGIRRLIRRCLVKDAKQRLRDIGDARIAIEETLAGEVGERSALPREGEALPYSPTGRLPQGEGGPGERDRVRAPLRRALPWLAAALLVLLVAGLFWLFRPSTTPQVTGMVQLTNDGHAKSPPLLSDGSRIFFGEGNHPSLEMAQVSVHGGEVAPATAVSVPQAFPLDISPDGSEFLMTQFTTTADVAPLWVVPVLAGSPRRVGNLMVNLNPQTAAWSQDMQRIAFARGDDLYTASPDGSGAKRLVSLPGEGFAVHWTPDGSGLALSVMDIKTGAQSLWELGADGTNLHQILPGWNSPPAECCGLWTADGKYLIFQATRNGITALWALPQKTGLFRRASHQPIQLTTGPIDMQSPVLSRDGKRMFTLGIQRRGKLVRYDAWSKSFVPYLGGASIEHVDFAKTGKWIAYRTYPESSLWRSKADGSSKLQLTFPPLQAFLPRWSPDASQIAFVGWKPGETPKIYVVPADGGEPVRVLPQDTAEEIDPVWSPDGNRLAFSKNPFAEVRSPQQREIEIVDLKTRKITPVPGSESLFSARWSPDGRYLVAMPHDSTRLTLFDFQSQKWQELVKMAIGYPNWSRDSKYVYFNDRICTGFYRVRVRGRKLEQVASLAGLSIAGDQWTGLAPDDSPMLLLDTSIDEIYAVDWTAP